jgi:hypothetical protein
MPANYEPKDYLLEALNWVGPDGTEQNGFLLLRELGKLYGKSSHEVGKRLEQLCYRDSDGRPTNKAFSGHFVAPRGNPKFTWTWHQQKTCAVLEAAGWKRVLPTATATTTTTTPPTKNIKG